MAVVDLEELFADDPHQVFRRDPPAEVGMIEMHDHRYAVGAEDDVQLQRVHALGQRAVEGGQRVLGRQPARAAVAVQVEGVRQCGGAQQGGDEQLAGEGDGVHGGS